MLCKRTGSISLLNAGFQQLVTLLKLMDYHWHKIKAFLWLVESSAEFSEQILYLSMQRRNRERNVCASSTWKPFLSSSYPWALWIPGMGTEAPPASGSDLVPPFPSSGVPPAAGTEGRGSHSAGAKATAMSNGEGGLGEPKASLCLPGKTCKTHGNGLSYTFCTV